MVSVPNSIHLWQSATCTKIQMAGCQRKGTFPAIINISFHGTNLLVSRRIWSGKNISRRYSSILTEILHRNRIHHKYAAVCLYIGISRNDALPLFKPTIIFSVKLITLLTVKYHSDILIYVRPLSSCPLLDRLELPQFGV